MSKDTNTKISFSSVKEKDLYYQICKERLHTLRKDIKLGKEPMYDFESSIDELLEMLML